MGSYCFGECNQHDAKAPVVMPFSSVNRTVDGKTEIEFSAEVNSNVKTGDSQQLKVLVTVQRPDDINIDPNQPLNPETFLLSCDKGGLCSGQYDHLDVQGEYHFTVIAENIPYISGPKTFSITQLKGKEVYPVQYDENLTTVYLRDVEFEGQHYQAALELQDGKFVLIAASLAPEAFSASAQFDSTTNVLTIPHALAFGQSYKARFKHLGNFEFELESATAK